MVEGLEVVIKYQGAKYARVANPATSSSAFAILKKDLAHLRVHSPSQRNVRRVDGSFILHWPTAGTSTKVEGLADSLHMRWFKLCSDDPEALKLREALSIESIAMTQDGILLRSTNDAEQASLDPPPGSLAQRLGDPSPETVQQSAPVLAPTHTSFVKHPLPAPSLPLPPPRLPPSAPRLDRQQPHLKRRMSTLESPPNLTRQKLDTPEALPTATALWPVNAQPQPPTSPRAGRQHRPPTPGDPAKSHPTPDDATPSTHAHEHPVLMAAEPPMIPPSPPREPGEMTPHTPLPILTPVSGPSEPRSDARPPPLTHHAPFAPVPSSPRPSSSSSGNGDVHAARLRDRDASRLMRELWDTRRQLTALQAREQVVLDDLERLGVRPENGAGAARKGHSQDELLRLEAELKAERARRARAERALNDVERECRAPFVVPALFQAFMSISDLSS